MYVLEHYTEQNTANEKTKFSTSMFSYFQQCIYCLYVYIDV